jgi:alkaline phosphatase D
MTLALRSRQALLAPLMVLILAGFAGTLHAAEPLRITHGIASGDVTPTGVVIWARASRAAQMMVEYVQTTAPSWPPIRRSGPQVEAKADFTGKVLLDGLAPDAPLSAYSLLWTAQG